MLITIFVGDPMDVWKPFRSFKSWIWKGRSIQKPKKSQNYETLEEFTTALRRALENSGITTKERTGLPEATNKFLVKFVNIPQKSKSKQNADNKNVLISKLLSEFIEKSIEDNEVKHFREFLNIYQDAKNFKEEYFYLLSFLVTLSVELAFYDMVFSAAILRDFYHRAVVTGAKVFNKTAVEIENTMRQRLRQYYEISRNENSQLNIERAIRQIPYDFYANVIKVETSNFYLNPEYRNLYGESIIQMQLWLALMIKKIKTALLSL